ncbi:1,4-alpha-glucan branching protein GlgB [Crocosphaera sp.]|uniref:1,4-alpha-glucan branching protein GlgB n=1 Tax=Crocosphaera sp. TaxID=2729996 RepID=UPI00260F1C68|nr:1,4-alpha-glucan branching protein GlgB [Crocosphaera sp.]MDJ0583082.1 1,4-alpha-glucan branching protein GlgB [Crocosphaera sp.]
MNDNATAKNPFLEEFDYYLFGQGDHHRIYEKMGAHLVEVDGVSGVYFATWAPNAHEVAVVGNFNNWNPEANKMQRTEVGIWELFIPGMKVGDLYKYSVKNHHHYCVYKTDPYGYQQEIRPATASVVADLSTYTWKDQEWIDKRERSNPEKQPMSVYEVHLGSWLHTSIDNPPKEGTSLGVEQKPGARYLNYLELAEQLIPYVKDMGYTHIELLPVTEYPFDGSWGYQVVGFYAPTSRYGPPQDFMYFVDKCHQEGIGVLLDWVPGHFPKDEHGLAYFDGGPLYEYEDSRKGEIKTWGTLVFDYGRNEVRNFLIASALFWFDKYHIDGIRVDAVAYMIELDKGREGDWVPNQYGDNGHLEAISFLQHLNNTIAHNYPGVVTIAEDSTAWGNVSRPASEGGLGFTFKWNMGWMNDTLKYLKEHPNHRSNCHNKLTFSIWYAFDEKFMLALSHDEVVHLKGHLVNKMPGDEWQKMANVRTLLTYMFAHPGKKTLFMGMEFGQTSEWQEFLDLDWYLLQYEPHKGLKRLVQDLNKMYIREPALYMEDFSYEGFEWIEANDAPRGLISFARKDPASGDVIVAVCNFKPYVYEYYWVGLHYPGEYVELINSDSQVYWGSGVSNPSVIHTREWHDAPWPYALEITVPPLGAVLYKLKR